ncbi:GyrI-like domain-containing protein [Algoriphagus winogradskyi]|uniref:AraC family transcriptional regulator n=1 Tax=Algoriphagus winogradskyi TaxID=237017 RepID=A0ABY1P5P1_9BACT|nr:GyrI-like domain-containing protein [Algoriphagus winogradskyi]SMP25576.1 AraC family transcriptional regulator [Algoriphagus winogradskyi]
MSIKPAIQILDEKKLLGMRVQMNFIGNRTQELWQKFMPRKNEIENKVSEELYSVEVYPSLSYFDQFNPATNFEKWAAVPVSTIDNSPTGLESLIIPAGLYAVFSFKGRDSEAPAMYQHILGNWLPNSKYQLDNRPHFAVMGEKYKNNDPDSEEEFWIPIKPKV